MDFAFLPTAWDFTSGGAYRQLSPWPLAIALFFLGFVITFILAAYYFGSKRPERGGEEAIPPEPETPPEPPEAEVVEEAPRAPKPPEDLAAKVARLKSTYKEGKMSREAYEANLRRLGVEVPVEPPKPSEEEERQRKIERLRTTYASGRISRTVYEDNLRALGVEPEPEPPKPEAAKAPSLPPAARERLKTLNKSLAEGRITQERYERILADVYAEVDPRFVELRKDLEAHRIVQAEYDARVRRLLAERRG